MLPYPVGKILWRLSYRLHPQINRRKDFSVLLCQSFCLDLVLESVNSIPYVLVGIFAVSLEKDLHDALVLCCPNKHLGNVFAFPCFLIPFVLPQPETLHIIKCSCKPFNLWLWQVLRDIIITRQECPKCCFRFSFFELRHLIEIQKQYFVIINQLRSHNVLHSVQSICHFNHFCCCLWSRQCRQLSFFHRTSLLTAPSLRTDPSALQVHSTSS